MALAQGYEVYQPDSPLDRQNRLLSAKNQLVTYQQNQLGLKQAQQQDADQQAIREAAQGALDANGQFDDGVFLKNLAQKAPHRVAEFQQKIAAAKAELQKKQADTQNQNLDNLGKQADFLGRGIQAVNDQAGYDAFLQDAKRNGLNVASFPPQFSPELKQKITDSAVSVKDHLAQQETATHNAAMEKKPTAEEQNFQSFYGPWLESKGLPKNAKNELTARKEYAQRNKSQVNISAGLTNDAMDQAAQRYLSSGELPPMGMGNAGAAIRTKILNRAAELGKGEDIAANKASYHADSTSLTKLTQQLNAVEAFENTAGKNLDLFLKTAEKVPDTGVPWLNTPLRAVSLKGRGSEEVAAFNAARQVALTEIARVVNNPNLTGVLSDSARQEIASLNPDSATFAQIKKVAGILKQDMANRHNSIREQVDSVKKGLRRQSASDFPVTAPNGKTYHFNSQADADAFKAKAGLK
jgi:hypothetical protein